MTNEPPNDDAAMSPALKLFFCLAGGLVLSVVLVQISYALQVQGFAPLVLLPLAIGFALGAGLGGLVRALAIKRRKLVIAGAIVWGLLVVLGQDYIGYRELRKQYENPKPGSALAKLILAGDNQFGPANFGEYLAARVRKTPVWWSVDLIVTVLAAGSTAAAVASPPRQA